MGKAAVGQVAGYWPDDVFRYLATPQAAIDDVLLGRKARRRGEAPALASGRATLSYEGLDEAATAIGAALLEGGEGGRLAVLLAEPLEALATLFGAARARVPVALFDPSLAAAEARRLLDGFGATLAVVGERRLAASLPAVEVVGPGELAGREAEPPRRWPPCQIGAPAVVLVSREGDLVWHSHTSVVAAGVSWATFLAVREEGVLATDRPVWTWEGLLTATTALFRGGTALLIDPGAPAALATAAAGRRGLWRLSDFDALLAAEQAGNPEPFAWLRASSGPLLTSVTGHVSARARRRVAPQVGTQMLPVAGLAATGPFLASHPSWSLPDSVGIPVTNVDLWPLNPRDGAPLRIPWEAVEFAELGVKSPMVAGGYGSPERDAQQVHEGWHRTRLIATMDPNGMFYLRPA